MSENVDDFHEEHFEVTYVLYKYEMCTSGRRFSLKVQLEQLLQFYVCVRGFYQYFFAFCSFVLSFLVCYRTLCLYSFCYYCQFINMYNCCVNVTVVIELSILFYLRQLVHLFLLAMFICVCFSLFVCLSFLSLLRNYELYVHHHRLPALMDISIW